jgi:Putative phage serine protease XkdF
MDMDFKSEVFKFNEEQRLVYGWAYVSTVKGKISLDHSGEYIRPEELVKAATNFMLDVRVAKAMHSGSQIGEIVHSLPVTNEIATSLGLTTDREGWIICVKIHDDDIWEDVKSGKLSAFSIGGRALRGTE